jgi:hypothetical protein
MSFSLISLRTYIMMSSLVGVASKRPNITSDYTASMHKCSCTLKRVEVLGNACHLE